MDEVVRLTHTPEYHDKPVKYIVWDKQVELAKMVSPKKPTFESGGQRGEGSDKDADFSSGGVTPLQAQQSLHEKRTSAFDIRQQS